MDFYIFFLFRRFITSIDSSEKNEFLFELADKREPCDRHFRIDARPHPK